ncbi:MAG: hypothetical protein R3230_00450 [Nitrosopumilaceae archaeon]|nr:hypothetical protein [Nitrosopumilaceae archaeon]
MLKFIYIFVISLFLTGCFSSNPVIFEENFSHPDLPNPVQPYTFDFKVITNENKETIINDGDVYLAIDYNDSLLFRQFLEDMKRYILESGVVICYYRSELEENFCKNQENYIEQKDMKSDY